MSDNIALRWLLRYKLYFLLGLIILGVQVFLAYKSLNIPNSRSHTNNKQYFSDVNTPDALIYHYKKDQNFAKQYSASDEDTNNSLQNKGAADALGPKQTVNEYSNGNHVALEQLGIHTNCNINAKETISSLQRAKTKDCRRHIAHIACAIQAGDFYAKKLPCYCPKGNHTAFTSLGCYRDEKELRLLSGYFINFKTSNTPQRCINLCLQSGYPYAGVQYGTECFCGSDAPPVPSKIPDSSCNMKCSGDARAVCGGYFSINIYETGIRTFVPRTAEIGVIKPEVDRVRIAFLLTLNGRALRQVHRLLKALYSPNNVFYIHVDARQLYLYRKLLELESQFPNIRLARTRFSTIWGGASLLTMLLQCMEDLLKSDWQWDYVINLSESDFPVKTVDKLVNFLTANKGGNFVKSHGRETQRFIQKQGLDKTFVECDTHMWRIGDRQLPNGIQMDGGSDWVALSRSFVHYVTSHAQDDPLLEGLLKIFRHTLLPAESFFHTVLRNSRFCDTYIDNNLHVTNWKRKLGCKCQYRHVVDWCGCSPNDFKPEDWSRLKSTEHKMLFFARKFEPIINQAILLQLETWLFGAHVNEVQNIHNYWQSFYDIADTPSTVDDVYRTVGDSLVRLMSRQLQVHPDTLLELTHYMHKDDYKGFLMRYNTLDTRNNESLELETRVRPVQYIKYAKNSKLAKRLRNFEVSSDFDLKEQVSRNFAKILGPHTELVLSFTFVGSEASANHDAAHSYNLTLLWIDPLGNLQQFSELHIEDSQTDAVNFSKPLLKHPLTPGIWTVKLIGRTAIYAQAKFLVVPLTIVAGAQIKSKKIISTKEISESSMPADFEIPIEWQQHIPVAIEQQRLRLELANQQSNGESLLAWVDELVSKFYYFRETCSVKKTENILSTNAVEILPLCRETSWSSLAPDPKSDIYALLKNR